MAMKTEPCVGNIGPQHPSTHGVFRMRLTLDGERITDADMVIGYLHRSMEKLAEERSFTQVIPFTDRTDYVAAMTGNLAYVLAVEKLCGIEAPERAQWLRVIMSELQRFASPSMAVGVFANDCGAWQTPVMPRFREREQILAELPTRMGEYEDLLLENEIIVARSRGVGVLPAELAIATSVSGPMLRGSGVAWDIRKAEPYAADDRLEFDICVGTNGDVYDRFLVRLAEMRQSIRILEQALAMIPGGPGAGGGPPALRAPGGGG